MSEGQTGRRPRVAIVHDQFYTYGGAEKVVERMLACFPDADLFALFDILPDDKREFLGGRKVTTSFLQRLPMLRRLHRYYFPLMPIAIEQLDLGDYDLILSSSYLVAKGVIVAPDQTHVCYLHSPMRYAWDMQKEYLQDMKLTKGPLSLVVRSILHYLRIWDVRSANGVDLYLANSAFIARRALKAYRRQAQIVHPPVDVEQFTCGPAQSARKDHFVTVGRLVPYKRFDLIIEAFNRMPDRELMVIGDGVDRKRLEKMAGPNVKIMGRLSDEDLNRHVAEAAAFVYAAQEDFGISPVEAMACGTPVIGLGKGGLTETVIPPGRPGEAPTGLLFDAPTADAIVAAVERFVAMRDQFDSQACRAHALKFAPARFDRELCDAVKSACAADHSTVCGLVGDTSLARVA